MVQVLLHFPSSQGSGPSYVKSTGLGTSSGRWGAVERPRPKSAQRTSLALDCKCQEAWPGVPDLPTPEGPPTWLRKEQKDNLRALRPLLAHSPKKTASGPWVMASYTPRVEVRQAAEYL